MGRRISRARRIAFAILATGVLGGLGGLTWSAFRADSGNSANSITSGTVAIGDGDAGSALFDLQDLKPSTRTRCILVTYTGSLAAGVRLFGTTTGSGLDAYMNLSITRGSGLTGGPGECTGFTADVTNHSGLGAGVIYIGTLTAFPDTYATGVADPDASWTTGEARAYMLAITLREDGNAVGKGASQVFTWEARNN